MTSQEIEALRRENRALKDKLARIERLGNLHLGYRLGLTVMESRFFSLLMRLDFVPRELAYDKLYSDREELVQDTALDAHIVNMRRKLGGKHIEITTVYGEGWYIEAGVRSKVLSRWGNVDGIVDAGRVIRGE